MPIASPGVKLVQELLCLEEQGVRGLHLDNYKRPVIEDCLTDRMGELHSSMSQNKLLP